MFMKCCIKNKFNQKLTDLMKSQGSRAYLDEGYKNILIEIKIKIYFEISVDFWFQQQLLL